jgi:hypothetical protein
MATRNPDWLLAELRAAIDESPMGCKGLAGAIGVSHVVLSYWLGGQEQWPPLRLRQIAETLGPVHGARFWQAYVGNVWNVSPAPRADDGLLDPVSSVPELARRSAKALHDLADSIADKRITLAEADVLTRDAQSLQALLLGAAAHREKKEG